nr:hypothetical protein OG781_02615 [Streptomyces sp. NBC_00830]
MQCGPAAVIWRDGALRAMSGGFEANSSLLLSPDASAWVVSGSGTTLGTGTGSTLALTRPGDAVGDQQRFAIAFDAAVRCGGLKSGELGQLGERGLHRDAGGRAR